ncbi:hypothetical protein NBRC10512_005270 [Rhodotorula toruloides]|uniref:RHTO0S23e01486g1_1 n=2 Tax=Rhodotorula toruloides TaxID=5286 RepID=A0A061BQ20_RHOTO|nr:BTB/POZ-like domain containing protein [Rhodotorula toruloides NP11]EMS18503.1 BTB/POZ-like domain containing protein [Rhodotorula toruloides NP11]CDR49139.1 RHTO0S23e01486g1_1 [Rhodotorula toruloides]
MAKQITLYTSDSPAKHLTVSRAVLAAHSTVFRDLLSIPTSAPDVSDPAHKDCSVAVAETEAEIKPFLSILTGEFDEPLELSEEEWKDVARLADKYDSKVVRGLVENKVRTLTDDESADFALNLAYNTRDRALLTDAAFRVLRLEDANLKLLVEERKSLTEPIKQDLARWKPMLREHARKIGYHDAPEYWSSCGSGSCTKVHAELAWYRGVHHALAADPSAEKSFAPFRRKIEEAAGHWEVRLCASHREALRREAMDFEEEVYRKTAPPFPR